MSLSSVPQLITKYSNRKGETQRNWITANSAAERELLDMCIMKQQSIVQKSIPGFKTAQLEATKALTFVSANWINWLTN